ncbi:MAG: formylglycine-generating enzyme family protein [Planctomycetes bacterium]|nr:formylglycine-generating enzyme family protein [Planctomycetota bacterium]
MHRTRFARFSIVAMLAAGGCGGPEATPAELPSPPIVLRAGVHCPAGFWPASDEDVGGWCSVIVHQVTGIRLRLIPGGTCTIGATEHETDGLGFVPSPNVGFWRPVDPDDLAARESPAHEREIGPFYLAETEVTIAQWRRFAAHAGYVTEAERGNQWGRGGFTLRNDGGRLLRERSDDARWSDTLPELGPADGFELREDHPVTQISWRDAVAFCDHFQMRLPAEAEWEYACRAGSSARFWWGDAVAGGATCANGLGSVRRPDPWPAFPDPYPLIAPVGSLVPNAFGLRDMAGNVSEWCADHYRHDAYVLAASATAPRDRRAPEPMAEDDSGYRCIRGGSFLDPPIGCRSAARNGMLRDQRACDVGFRPAMSLPRRTD